MRFNYKNSIILGPAKFQSFHDPPYCQEVSMHINANPEHQERASSLNYQMLHLFYCKNKLSLCLKSDAAMTIYSNIQTIFQYGLTRWYRVLLHPLSLYDSSQFLVTSSTLTLKLTPTHHTWEITLQITMNYLELLISSFIGVFIQKAI